MTDTPQIDAAYLAEVRQRYRLRTDAEAIDFVKKRRARLPMTREEALCMQGARLIEFTPDDHA